MSKDIKELIVDGLVYVLKDSKDKAKDKDGMKYVIVRTYSAGCFAGYLESRKGKEVVIRDARRLWYWDGSASLSELAIEGVGKPENCKFPAEVDRIELTEAIEILDCTEKAKKSIANVKIWSAQ